MVEYASILRIDARSKLLSQSHFSVKRRCLLVTTLLGSLWHERVSFNLLSNIQTEISCHVLPKSSSSDDHLCQTEEQHLVIDWLTS